MAVGFGVVHAEFALAKFVNVCVFPNPQAWATVFTRHVVSAACMERSFKRLGQHQLPPVHGQGDGALGGWWGFVADVVFEVA